jgi:hypothetical protein
MFRDAGALPVNVNRVFVIGGGGGWHSLPEPALDLDNTSGIRWRNGHLAN